MRQVFKQIGLLVLSLLANINSFAYDFIEDGIYYNIVSTTELTVEVAKYHTSGGHDGRYKGNIVIPSNVTYNEITYSVTGIEAGAFEDCFNLVSVSIPNSVESIPNMAFYGCSKLSSIIIPESVTGIGMRAFQGCTSLCTISIPNCVSTIGKAAFEGCTGLVTITIPNSLTTISDYTFCDCTDLNTLSIPNSITEIGYGAFLRCRNLISIDFGNHVNIIGPMAFSSCSSLKSIIIPNSVTTIKDEAFKNCNNIKTINFGDSVKTIGEEAFINCSNIESLTIPNSVTSIGGKAFYGFTINSLTIGTSVKSIGVDAFVNPVKTIWLCNHAFYSSCAEGEINYVSYDIKDEKYKVYPFLSSIFEVDGVKYVPISPSERTCDAIDCLYDESVEYLEILSSVSYNGINMTVEHANPYVLYGNKYIKNILIDTNVGKFAFYNCSSLEHCSLGNKTIIIDLYTFGKCSELQEIVIPDSVNSIGSSAFWKCTSLKDVQIGKSVKSIDDGVFEDCSALSQIEIPNSVEKIGNNAFRHCNSLSKLFIADSNVELNLGYNGLGGGVSPLFSYCSLDSVYIGRKIKYDTRNKYGYSPFYNNTSLRTVVITDKETEISQNEFYGCTNLQNFTIGDGVTKISDRAFSGCSSLKSISLGSQLKEIGKEAFSDCASVTEITCKAAVPPSCGSQALDDINKWACTLYVPQGSLTSYQVADQWKEFFFIEEGILHIGTMTTKIHCENGLISIIGANDGTKVCVFDVNGILLGSAISQGEQAVISTQLRAGSIAIVKIEKSSVRMLMK